MSEVSPGIYEAKWIVPSDMKVDRVAVEYSLQTGDAQLIETAAGLISLRPGGLKRIQGENRYETAALVSSNQYDRSEVAVIVSGENFPEALAAGIYANHLEGPLLLSGRASIAEQTLSELDRLGVKRVELIGGELAISRQVEQTLEAQGYLIHRISGQNRYETNVKLSMASHEAADTVFLVSGEGFADGLSVAPIAYEKGAPLLLSSSKSLPQQTLQAIKDFGATKVVLVGGPEALSPAIEAELARDYQVTRIGGDNRYQTNIRLYEACGITEVRGVFIASGKAFADALAGGVMAGQLKQPMILTEHRALPAETLDYLEDLRLAEITLLGGELAVSRAVEVSLREMLN